jgi:hypothetical protein
MVNKGNHTHMNDDNFSFVLMNVLTYAHVDPQVTGVFGGKNKSHC